VLAALAATALVVVGLVAPAHAAVPVDRLQGSDRYSTSAAIAKASFTRGVKVAYVASGLDFPDALAGAAVAGRVGAPVLLVAPGFVPPPVAEALNDLKPGAIVVLGGANAVSGDVVTALGAYTSGGVTRVEGPNRYATAANLSHGTYPENVPLVYVASGRNYPDALSGAAAAGSRGAPLLIVPGDHIPTEVQTELTRLSPRDIVVLGGESAVSKAVANQLEGHAPVKRLFGSNRYATSANISKESFGAGASVVYVANGRGFPDALSGAPVAGMLGAPVLLVGEDAPAEVRAELVRLKARKIVVLGGPGAVSDAVVRQLTGERDVATSEIARIAATYKPPAPSRGAGAAALTWARTQLGVPYFYGGTGPEGGDAGYDCSGLVMRAYQHAGVTLRRTTSLQWADTTRVALADLQPGDIIFWSRDGEPSGIYHNALYAGVDPVTGKQMRLQAPSPGKTVELVPMLEANLLPFGGRIG
jgi:putative cell wall-binding protein